MDGILAIFFTARSFEHRSIVINASLMQPCGFLNVTGRLTRHVKSIVGSRILPPKHHGQVSAALRFFRASNRAAAAQPLKVQSELEKRIAAVPIERFRNFCIVAHVDHGKSTLSDRLLELTGTIQPGSNKQVLDKLDVERERGITVKAQTCSMIYNYKGEDYLLHLVDTPGHVDFRAEVSRSYASCGGGTSVLRALVKGVCIITPQAWGSQEVT